MKFLAGFLLGFSALFTVTIAQEVIPEIIIEPVACEAKIDLIILIDGSESVKRTNFILIKSWIKDLARSFNIESGNVQIGVVQYSYWSRRRPMWRQRYINTEIKLGEYKTTAAYNRAVDRIQYQGYQTFTAHALTKIVDYDFQGRNSRYPEAQRAIILLTDGKATDGRDLTEAVEHAEKDAGAVIFAVGVGEYSLRELQLITSNDNRRIFELQNFNELENIVYELPSMLQKACDCDPRGSLSNECDVCTRECVCKPNVVGRRCDMCAAGTYNISHPGGCLGCRCNPQGTKNECDKRTGKCECHLGVVGEKCDRCIKGRFGFPNCTLCQCNGFAAKCNKKNGICIKCEENRAGDHCEKCKSGLYSSQSGQCIPCECNGHIDIMDPQACNPDTGKCLKCLDNTSGPHCETCAEYFYRDHNTDSCERCVCDLQGTDDSTCSDGQCTCDRLSGQCTCNPTVTGKSCNQCAVGFWDYQPGAECTPCNCHLSGSRNATCNTGTGECECIPGHVGTKCDDCDVGYFRKNLKDACQICRCDEIGTDSMLCEEDLCKCDPTTGQCPCLSGVLGLKCDACKDDYWGLLSGEGCKSCDCSTKGSNSSVCNKETGECECLSGYAGPQCKLCDYGFSRSDEGNLCIECECNQLGTDKLLCNDGKCSCNNVTAQCPCRPNVSGPKCDRCVEDHWGFESESGCKPCQCEEMGSREVSCSEETGKCECVLGYDGTKCEKCDEGYFRGNTKEPCRECECNILGTESTCLGEQCSCDAVTGQCQCRPNVVGLNCDECSDGFWNLENGEGCEPCGCHGRGSESNICDKGTGKCECLAGHEGQKCGKCELGHSRVRAQDPCASCDCDLSGTNSSSCDLGVCACDYVTGQCQCLPNVEGLTCDKCAGGFWGYGRSDGCQKCDCHASGSSSSTCDKGTGQCVCLPGHSGRKCDGCEEGYTRKNPTQPCEACECDSIGTDSSHCDNGLCSCNPTTGQCPCLPGVTGMSCERCEDEFWGVTIGLGCEPCDCKTGGSVSGICNQDTGQCDCLVGYAGRQCHMCDTGHFISEAGDSCTTCECNMHGTDKSLCKDGKCACNNGTSQCPCLPHVSGLQCDSCLEGYWRHGSTEGCIDCDCDGMGSISSTCNSETGMCECLPGYTGMKCDRCRQGYFRINKEDSCKECECESLGSVTCEGDTCTCDPVTGQCQCHQNVVGRNCDECADGFWNLEHGTGCEHCGCHGRGSQSGICDKTTGKCDCLFGYTGLKCEECELGHSRANQQDICASCDCDLSGTNSSACDLGVCSCDAATGQCPCLPNIVGVMCDQCADGFWDYGKDDGCQKCGCHSLGSLSTTCNKGTGECECLPGHTGNKCAECERGYSRKNAADKCKVCRCNDIGTDSSLCEDGFCVCHPATGQCPCLPGVTGLACTRCEDEFWGLTEREGCKSCDCEASGSQSHTCDKNTGACQCLTGHAGQRCEKCERGYFRTIPEEQCRECKCNMYGRDSTSCDGEPCDCEPATGQCYCLPNVTGLTCDRCGDGYWDIGSMQGCKPCGCHAEGSTSSICEKKSGQCDCVEGHIGRQCENCNKGFDRKNPRARCESDTLNDDPTPSTSTPSETTSTTTSTKVLHSKRPLSTYSPHRPTTSRTRNTGCNRCLTWPSYCHGWMCRRRWPHHGFKPAPRRCNYGHRTCQYNVANTHGQYGVNSRRPTALVSRATPRPYYGYSLYGNHGNYYMRSHSGRRSRTYSYRSQSRPSSYGLYKSLYGGWRK